MINSLIRLSIAQRFLVLILVALLAVLGVYSLRSMPIDAVPDVTNVQVQILTSSPALPPLEVAARTDGEKALKVKCIRHSDCVEVGRDRFEEMVSDFLGKVGETNVVNVNTFNYQHLDLGTRQMVTDYGIMVVYRA